MTIFLAVTQEGLGFVPAEDVIMERETGLRNRMSLVGFALLSGHLGVHVSHFNIQVPESRITAIASLTK